MSDVLEHYPTWRINNSTVFTNVMIPATGYIKTIIWDHREWKKQKE